MGGVNLTEYAGLVNEPGIDPPTGCSLPVV